MNDQRLVVGAPDSSARPNKTVRIGGLGGVYPFGLGTANLGGDISWGLTRHEQLSIDAIRFGLDGHRRLVDTSPAYGPNLAEELLCRALQQSSQDDVLVATKAGMRRSQDGTWITAGTPEAIRESVQQSLHNLQVTHLDLVQLHLPDPDVPLAESLGVLFALRNEGTIREVGACNLSATQLAEALTCGPIATLQNRLSVESYDAQSEAVLGISRADRPASLTNTTNGVAPQRARG